jgi:hypothetical protein
MGLAAACLVGLGLSRCGRIGSGLNQAVQRIEEREEAKLVDEDCADLIKDKTTVADARTWLKDEKKSVLYKGDRQMMVKHFDELAATGVKQFYAVNLEQIGDGKQMTSEFVVAMPTEAAARTKVIQLHNAFWTGYVKNKADLEDYLVQDHGQKYLYYQMFTD